MIDVRGWVAARRARMGSDRGDTAIQMAILFPFLIVLTIGTVQYAMLSHARNIALTAAREGVTAGRAYQSSPGEGAARSREVLGRIAGSSLNGPAVSTAGSSANTMQVTVTGTAVSLLPGVSGLHVSQSAAGPRERWTVAP